MRMNTVKKTKLNWAVILAWSIIAIGIVLRIVVYLQNRNLIIDESNVARNIYERGFLGLTQPLYYEQYAPVLFLWMVKLSSLLFGFSEYALRIYPLLTGIASMFVFYKVLEKFMSSKALLYPLVLFAGAHILLRYSSELKQYMPDVLISLVLIWLALSIDIKKTSVKKFFLVWLLAGSIAIWSSMPSVFLLFAIGCYYGYICVRSKSFKQLVPLIVVAVLWLIQFAAYYYTILEPQANSKYLQDFHRGFFLYFTPESEWEKEHNWWLLYNLLHQFEGEYAYINTINVTLLFGGIILMLIKDTAKGILLFTALGALFLASALNQFSLLERVSLFSIPLMLIVIGYGFDRLLSIKWMPVKLVMLAVGLFGVWCNVRYSLESPYKYEELTTGLEYMKEQGVLPEAISIYHSSVPAWKYYTRIHPQKDKWADYKKSDTLMWSTEYNLLAQEMRTVWQINKPVGFVFTNATEGQTKDKVGRVEWHLKLIKELDTYPVKCYIFENPDNAKLEVN